jgi:hypothetical protein
VLLKKMIATTLGTTVGLAGLLLAGAGPAEAASADQAAAICGPGYSPLGSDPLAASIIYISYNNGTDCAVNIKTQNVGTPSSVFVHIEGGNPTWGGNDDGGSWDGGDFSYYAGPVYTYAPHTCITWGGGDGYISEDYGPDYCN